MRQDQWEQIKRCILGEPLTQPLIALLADSPWIPGYVGVSTLDYVTLPEVWLESNLTIVRQFPEIVFIPGFWLEVGMAAEPSGFGCKVSFFQDKPPAVHPLTSDITQAASLQVPNPSRNGWMAVVINTYKYLKPRIHDAGYLVKIVASRGPLTIASHLMGINPFLVALKRKPDLTHKFLRTVTQLVKDWLEAQLEALKDAEGILVLDDVAGFLSPRDYEEFAHPYLKQVFDSFPGLIKLFHNDTNNTSCYSRVAELGVHIFNFTHLQPIDLVRKLVGEKVCLMGNIPPLDILANGTEEQVRLYVNECLKRHNWQDRLIISAGGGLSPGTPRRNLVALVEAVKAYVGGSRNDSSCDHWNRCNS